jgi:hypothetical protein
MQATLAARNFGFTHSQNLLAKSFGKIIQFGTNSAILLNLVVCVHNI